MKIHYEKSLSNFEFWSGAKDFAEKLTEEEFNTIERLLEDSYPEGIGETTLNDIFWFEDEMLADWIGETVESILERE